MPYCPRFASFGLLLASACLAPPAALAAPLNDTGIVRCGDASSNDLDCPVANYPGQDAEYGRDVTHNDPSDGHAGFSFTKLDANGRDLPASATNWSCVRDNVTGLIWEVKTDDGGLRDMDWTYTWYNPDPTSNGGDPGVQDGGTCEGSACDTYAYTQAVNAQRLCNANDWILPAREELRSLISYDRVSPAIDANYFPRTVSDFFLTASIESLYRTEDRHQGYGKYVWIFQFDEWRGNIAPKDLRGRVRLVRKGSNP